MILKMDEEEDKTPKKNSTIFFNRWLSVADKLKIIQYAEERGIHVVLINIEF